MTAAPGFGLLFRTQGIIILSMEYFIVLLGCALGSGLNIVCGFGLGVFCMMFFPYVMGNTMEAAALINIVAFTQAAIFCVKYRKYTNWKLLFVPILAYFLFSWLTVRFASGLGNDTMRRLLGGFMLALSLYFFFIAKRIRLKPCTRNGIIAGGLGGVMSGLFSIGGPPIGLYFSAATEEKEVYLATIQSYYTLSNAYIICLRAAHGNITPHVLTAAIFALTGMGLGSFLGNTIFKRLHADHLRKAMYAMMAVSGVIMLLEG